MPTACCTPRSTSTSPRGQHRRGVPPARPAPEGGFPVIAWAHGTVGLGDDCTPSALPRTPRDDEYLFALADQGYAIVASDYAGLGTPGLMSYLNSVTTAHGVVDSVIAAHGMGLPLSPRWAIVGQSQGGGAAISSARWATEFSQGTGLDYRGVVATGTPANIDKFVYQTGPDFQAARARADRQRLHRLHPCRAARGAARPRRRRRLVPRAWTPPPAPKLSACIRSRRTLTTAPGRFFTAPLLSIPGMADALHAFMGTPSRVSTDPSSSVSVSSTATCRQRPPCRSITSWSPTIRTSPCTSTPKKTTAAPSSHRWPTPRRSLPRCSPTGSPSGVPLPPEVHRAAALPEGCRRRSPRRWANPAYGLGVTSTLGGSGDGSGCVERRMIENVTAPTASTATPARQHQRPAGGAWTGAPPGAPAAASRRLPGRRRARWRWSPARRRGPCAAGS